VLNSIFHAKNRCRHYTQIVTKKSDTTEVEPGETRSWTSVRIGVPPYIPESRLDGCDMIDIGYELQVRTKCVIYTVIIKLHKRYPCRGFSYLCIFLSRVSILLLTRDIDIVILSVCLSVCLSVRDTLVMYENGLTYRHSFSTIR